MKKTILVDLDGVLNEYTGKYDENNIPQIREGALDFLKNLSQNFIIKIFTTRPKQLALEWIKSNNLEQFVSDITNTKEPAYVIVDDRCINFGGNYSDTIEKIKNFKVWYK